MSNKSGFPIELRRAREKGEAINAHADEQYERDQLERIEARDRAGIDCGAPLA